MKEYNPLMNQYDCHLIMEKVNGLNLDQYIANNIRKKGGPPPSINLVKKFGI